MAVDAAAAAAAAVATEAAGPFHSSCDACAMTAWRGARRSRRRLRSWLLAAPGSATAAAGSAILLLLLLLLLVVRAGAQGVLRGAAGAASRKGLEAEIGAEGAAADKRLLSSSLFGPTDDAAAARALQARLLPLGTYLLHLDVEGNFPASPFPFSFEGGDKARASYQALFAAATAMRSMQSQTEVAQRTNEQTRLPRYILLDTFIRLLFFDQRSVAEASPSRHPLLPMCGLVAPIVDTPGFCSAVAFVEARGSLLLLLRVLGGVIVW